jgi:hypothetical protein
VVRLGRVVDGVQDCMPEEEGNIAHDLGMHEHLQLNKIRNEQEYEQFGNYVL